MVEWKLGEGSQGTAAGWCGHVVSLLWRCEEKGGLRREGDGRKVALPSPMGSGTCAPERAEVSRGPPLPSQAPSLHLGKVGV